jgi:hypothetical protein
VECANKQGAMCEVVAPGEALGAGGRAHGALWGVCALVGEPMELALHVRRPSPPAVAPARRLM